MIDKDRLRRSGAGDLNFGFAHGFDLVVQGAAGDNVFDIKGKRGDLWLHAGSADDTINVGAEGGLLSR